MNQLLLRPVRLILPVLSLWLAAGLSAASPDSLFRVIEELDVKVTTRDGVRLSTNIYRPDTPGRFPALLTRTPYGNGGAGDSFRHYFAARGYAVVVQDTRGRYESEGEFDAFQSEGPDGLDTHQWLAAQPWCDGRIGTWGGSYVGFTQWLPAGLGSPHVRAMFPIVTFSDLHDMVWQGGAFRLGLFSGWSLEMHQSPGCWTTTTWPGAGRRSSAPCRSGSRTGPPAGGSGSCATGWPTPRPTATGSAPASGMGTATSPPGPVMSAAGSTSA